METLDGMIAKLHDLRAAIGKDCQVFVSGWNDTGIVAPSGPRTCFVTKTRFDEDGEITRLWEETPVGEAAVVIE